MKKLTGLIKETGKLCRSIAKQSSTFTIGLLLFFLTTAIMIGVSKAVPKSVSDSLIAFNRDYSMPDAWFVTAPVPEAANRRSGSALGHPAEDKCADENPGGIPVQKTQTVMDLIHRAGIRYHPYGVRLLPDRFKRNAGNGFIRYERKVQV